MVARSLPSPQEPIVDKDGKPRIPWYQYLMAADDTWRPVLQVISTGTTANTVVPNDGVTVIQTTPPTTHTLANPEPGVRKVIVVQSASTTGRVASSSTTNTIKPGSGWALTFSSSASDKLIELIGVSTADWYIVSNPGSVSVTT